jgi:hypothetical protein
MNHIKKKRGVPDAMSGTPLRSVCGILCGQRKSAKPHSFKKLQKERNNTRNPKISGVVLSCCTTVDFCLHAKNQFTRVHDIKKSAERALLKFQVE